MSKTVRSIPSEQQQNPQGLSKKQRRQMQRQEQQQQALQTAFEKAEAEEKARIEQQEAVEKAKAMIPAVVNGNMIELQPFISCLVRPEHFEEALASHYSQIYVDMGSGKYMKHMKLSAGRFVRLEVDKLPVNVKLPQADIKEELNFLPGGKIPADYWKQIVQFFRQVMTQLKSDYEAHAWILWEKDKGYYISVPKQVVSKASVEFSYDAEALPPGAIIVVDIHSHNTMGAFYSGTDNNNDKNGIYYSGVVGNITPTSYSWVMRFNLHEVKREVKLSEIFDMQEEQVEVPKAWLDQVQLRTYQGPANPNRGTWVQGQTGGTTPTAGKGTTTTNHQSYENGRTFWTAHSSIKEAEAAAAQQSENPFPRSQPSLWEQQAGAQDLEQEFAKRFPATSRNGSRGVGRRARVIDEILATQGMTEEEIREANDELAAMHYISNGQGELRQLYVPGGPEDDITDGRVLSGFDEEQQQVAADQDIDVTNEESDLFHFDLVANYDEIAINHGEDCANAYSMIDHYITEMEGYDEGLLDVIQTAFHLLSSSGQAKIQQNGIG